MVTQKKDLRTGTSVWSADANRSLPFQALEKDIITDVVVIGAGISGALMAEEFSSRGFSVVILDRRGPIQGSTVATTALLQYDIDVPLSKLQQKIGFDSAVRAWRRTKLSLDSLADKTRLLGIDCDLRQEASLYLSGKLLDNEGLQQEQELRTRIGLQCKYLSPAESKQQFGLNRRACLYSLSAYSANPYKMAQGYLKLALANKAQIFAPVEVVDINAGPRIVHVKTKQGATIRAKHVIFCTGYEIPKQLAHQNCAIASTWAIATAPVSKKATIPMMWEASDPYLYLRQLPDGRIICGGEDEAFSNTERRDALIAAKSVKLLKKMETLLSVKTKIEYAWCGSFGITPTGLPLMGAVPGMQNCYAVMAFGGNGIVNARTGAEIICNLVMGKGDPDEDVFKFDK